MIASHEKEKFVIGKIYWTYFMELTNDGRKIRNYCKPFQVIPVSLRKEQYGQYFEWNILNGSFSKTMENNIHTFMNGYGLAYCRFFETESECNEYHDKQIIEWSKYLNTYDRNQMYKKLKGKIPNISKIEEDSILWITKLNPKEREYLRWIKEYYEGEI